MLDALEDRNLNFRAFGFQTFIWLYKPKGIGSVRSSLVTRALCYKTKRVRTGSNEFGLIQPSKLNTVIQTSRDRTKGTCQNTKLVRYSDVDCIWRFSIGAYIKKLLICHFSLGANI